MKGVCQTLIGRRIFTIEVRCESFGFVCWVAMMLVSLAVTLCGPIRVYPSNEDGEEVE